MMRTTNLNSFKAVPELDQRYIQELQEKDRITKNRIEKRNKQQDEVRELTVQSVTKTLEFLTNHKKEMTKRNAIFQNDMRSHVERFHREIAKVYTADDNLRETKRVMDTYLRKFKPQVAAQLKNVLSNQSHSLEAKIFNVKNHAPIILNKNNELIRLEQTHKELQEAIVKEELKQDIIQAKSNIPQSAAKPQSQPQNHPQNNYESRELAATKKLNQPQQYQQYNRSDDNDLQKFEDDSDIDKEDNYRTQKNPHQSSQKPLHDTQERVMANPNQTQKNPHQNNPSQYGIKNDKTNNETKRRQNNVFDEEVNEFDDEF